MAISVADILIPPQDALAELGRRQQDKELRARVEEFLGGDLPSYLEEGPALCLAQHLFTPNFETLRFLRLIQHLGLRAVVSYDSKSLFVSQNSTKRALVKLPVCTRVTQKGWARHEHYQDLTIIDFNASDGKDFSRITTTWGEPLIDFHSWLAGELGLSLTCATDDASWIDRHKRGDLATQYVQFLSLFVTHGIMFETYELDNEVEVNFLSSALRPAYELVKEKFGCAPLICELSPTIFESSHFWLSYPAPVLKLVRNRARGGGVKI